MKKYNLTGIVLVCIVVISIMFFCKAVYADDDFIFDILCNTNDLPLYAEFFITILLCFGILYEHETILSFSSSVIAYLARNEKSPPVNSAIFLTA